VAGRKPGFACVRFSATLAFFCHIDARNGGRVAFQSSSATPQFESKERSSVAEVRA